MRRLLSEAAWKAASSRPLKGCTNRRKPRLPGRCLPGQALALSLSKALPGVLDALPAPWLAAQRRGYEPGFGGCWRPRKMRKCLRRPQERAVPLSGYGGYCWRADESLAK
mmetsp:Transcript_52784/g.114061  ORF Transcript_52784/g.114061 Transcript_52784/m.114061 type:complete len:110 (-) Transcript_52784:19-348(-)